MIYPEAALDASSFCKEEISHKYERSMQDNHIYENGNQIYYTNNKDALTDYYTFHPGFTAAPTYQSEPSFQSSIQSIPSSLSNIHSMYYPQQKEGSSCCEHYYPFMPQYINQIPASQAKQETSEFLPPFSHVAQMKDLSCYTSPQILQDQSNYQNSTVQHTKPIKKQRSKVQTNKKAALNKRKDGSAIDLLYDSQASTVEQRQIQDDIPRNGLKDQYNNYYQGQIGQIAGQSHQFQDQSLYNESNNQQFMNNCSTSKCENMCDCIHHEGQTQQMVKFSAKSNSLSYFEKQSHVPCLRSDEQQQQQQSCFDCSNSPPLNGCAYQLSSISNQTNEKDNTVHFQHPHEQNHLQKDHLSSGLSAEANHNNAKEKPLFHKDSIDTSTSTTAVTVSNSYNIPTNVANYEWNQYAAIPSYYDQQYFHSHDQNGQYPYFAYQSTEKRKTNHNQNNHINEQQFTQDGSVNCFNNNNSSGHNVNSLSSQTTIYQHGITMNPCFHSDGNVCYCNLSSISDIATIPTINSFSNFTNVNHDRKVRNRIKSLECVSLVPVPVDISQQTPKQIDLHVGQADELNNKSTKEKKNDEVVGEIEVVASVEVDCESAGELIPIQSSKKTMNETKNIPKNYSKAIIGYIQKHPEECTRLLGESITFGDFEEYLLSLKDKITAIKDLRDLWTSEDIIDVESKINSSDNDSILSKKIKDRKEFHRVFRILSFKFFRENAISYIYSSRKIKNTKALISHKFVLQRALHAPQSFSFMKLQN